MNIFHTYLYQPIFNLLVFLYNVIPGADVGFAIIALTVIIKMILWPFMNKSLQSQKALQQIQPKIEELKTKHKDNKEALAKEMMELYQQEKVNPLSSCLPILLQLPVLIALYQVLLNGFGAEQMSNLYPFIQNPGTMNHIFLGLVDLSKVNIVLAVLAGGFQFWQTKMMIGKQPPKEVKGTKGAQDESVLASMNKSMMYFMPVVTVMIGASLPGGLTLYWVTITVVSIIQQLIVFKKKEKKEQK